MYVSTDVRLFLFILMFIFEFTVTLMFAFLFTFSACSVKTQTCGIAEAGPSQLARKLPWADTQDFQPLPKGSKVSKSRVCGLCILGQ